MSNLGVAVGSIKPITSGNPSSERIRFEERRLTAACLGMAKALPSRPEPREPWDNIARGRAVYKGRDAVLMGKDVMRDALASGDRTIIDESAQNVAHYFEELKHAALADYLEFISGSLTLDAARLAASKEGTEAVHAIVQSFTGSPTELTVREIDEAIEALVYLRARMPIATDQSHCWNKRTPLAITS